MDRGKPAAKIDEIPLHWFFGPGVKLDFRHFPDGHVVSAAEVEAELGRIGHALEPGDIVLVNTSAGERRRSAGLVPRHDRSPACACSRRCRGPSRSATAWSSSSIWSTP
ncbi:MAG: cyclase family protein [Burkholderiales bacterium]|nr:MAG: cyclase family protein [Burkholderiales bacterium]